MNKRLFLGLLVLAGLSMLFLAAPARADDAPAPRPALTEALDASRLVELMNRERVAAGVPPLEVRDDVTALAVAFSREMASQGAIWHNDAYFSPDTRERLAASALGENVALHRFPDDAHARLMSSPGHRANILNGAFTVVGVGAVRDGDGRLFITEDFLAPRSTRRSEARPDPAVPERPAEEPGAAAPPTPVSAPPARPSALAAPSPPRTTVPPPAAPPSPPAPVAAPAVAPPLSSLRAPGPAGAESPAGQCSGPCRARHLMARPAHEESDVDRRAFAGAAMTMAIGGSALMRRRHPRRAAA